MASEVDALRARLQESYARQRAERLTAVQRRVDEAHTSVLEGGAHGGSVMSSLSKNNAVKPAATVTAAAAQQQQQQLELASPELTQVLTELEALCARCCPDDGGVALVRRARALVQRDLREALSYMEQGYTSAFHELHRVAAAAAAATAADDTVTSAAAAEVAAAMGGGGGSALPSPSHTVHVQKDSNGNDNNKDSSSSARRGDAHALVTTTTTTTSPSSTAATAMTTSKPPAATAVATAAVEAVDLTLLRQCPAEWLTQDKLAVLRELAYQSTVAAELPAMTMTTSRRGAPALVQQPPPPPPSPPTSRPHATAAAARERRLTLRQSLSTTTALFAESLATLLTCEVVRIYLYDEHDNLHCCATYPCAAMQADPMRGTYVEVMLAKQLHHTVCDKGVAVNGSEVDYTLMQARDVAQIEQERQAKGWASMRSCLIFPIIAHTQHHQHDDDDDDDEDDEEKEDGSDDDDDTSGSAMLLRQQHDNNNNNTHHHHSSRDGDDGQGRRRRRRRRRPRRRALGMIHAVNKLAPANAAANRFTSDDEVLALVCARVLGCMLSRYPPYYFMLRVGQALQQAVYGGHGDTAVTRSLDSHLPLRVCDADVGDAARMANRAQTTPTPVSIYRAPLSSIYETHAHRSRKRRLGKLLVSDQTLASVDFQLSLVNQSWAAGLADNTRMHQQYRELSEQLSASKLLLRNVLDSLAVARAMGDDAASVARYLQRLELLGRSESTNMIVELMESTLAYYTALSSSSPSSGKNDNHDDNNHDGKGGVATARTRPTTTTTTTLPPLLLLPPPPSMMSSSSSSSLPASSWHAQRPLSTASSVRSAATTTASTSPAVSARSAATTTTTAAVAAVPSDTTHSTAAAAALLASDNNGSTNNGNNKTKKEDDGGSRVRGEGAHDVDDASPFVRGAALSALARHVRVINQPVVATMHSDGPDGVRAYSTDPARKRAQVRFIKDMVQRSGLSSATSTLHEQPQQQQQQPPPPSSSSSLLLRPPSSHAAVTTSTRTATTTTTTTRRPRAQHHRSTTAATAMGSTATRDFAIRRPFCIQ